MKNFILGIAVAVLGLGLAPPAASETPPTADGLIDRLTEIDCHGPGLKEYFPFSDFWAVVPETNPDVHEGRDCVPPAMRALVRMGPRALPALVRHIDDRRPTRLKIGEVEKPGTIYLGGQGFVGEYDSRAHVYEDLGWPWPFTDKCPGMSCPTNTWRGFPEPYTIRVGDVCFILIGQIVNRRLTAARYQPTGFVFVNSPVEAPALAARVRADWSGVDTEGLKNALLADLRTPLRAAPPGYKRYADDPLTYDQRQQLSLGELYDGALRRLRFYYPETYAALTGPDLEKRRAFEMKAEPEDR
jgi:hypothetical protein